MRQLRQWAVFIAYLSCVCVWLGNTSSAHQVKRSAATSGSTAAAASFAETGVGQLTVVTDHGAPVQEHEHGQESHAERTTELFDKSDWEIILQELKETGNEIDDGRDDYIHEEHPKQRRRKRFVSNNTRYVWPKGIVPYDFNMNATGEFYRDEALASMTRWHKYTCIRFVPWVLGETKEKYGLTEESHVTITKGTGCAAHQGNIHSKKGQYNSCCRRYVCTHELGHTLGLWHEHQSPLRESIMKLDRNRVPGGMEWTYNMRYLRSKLVYQYDTSNTMHYGGAAFNILYEDLKPVLRFSNQYYMYKDVSLFHECKELHCASFTRQCHNDGFVTLVDNQCSCLCPPGLDPSTDCATTVKQVVTGSSWPAGSFALFSSTAGCPGNEFVGGSWQHQGKGNNQKSIEFHLAGTFNADIFRYKFCTREDSSGAGSAPAWEPGRYCVLRVNGACPQGFEEGFIQFDDHVNSTGQTEGRLPDGHFEDNKDTCLQFCCRDDGFASTPLINLPNTKPLVLLLENGTSACQEVAGMHWTKEYMWFDSFADNAAMAGSHPYVYKGTTFKIAYCHYIPADFSCGGEIVLDTANPEAIITSPNYPLAYGTNMECNWIIKAGEEGGQVLLNFDVMKVTSDGSDCKDSLEIRYNLPGQPGIRYCGDGLGRTIRSLNDSVILTLRTDNQQVATDIGFSLNASLHVPEKDGCYEPSTKGRLYRGQKNYTRGMKACLPWTQVTNCEFHAFQPRDYGSGLEENYCRNPDNTAMPWCYTDSRCARDFCDVCNIERIYDRSASCSVDECHKSTEEIIQAGCAETCGLVEPPASQTDQTCGEPEKPSDASFGGQLPGKLNPVGQRVDLQCLTGPDYLHITCLSNGKWSPAGYVCGTCTEGWAFYSGSCYKYFMGGEGFLGARQICSNHAARVTSVRNKEEQAFVSSLRQHLWPMWIGVTDKEVEGEYRWEDGQLVDWFNWNPAKSHESNSRDCVVMDTDYKNRTWTTQSCDTIRPFVCQYSISERTLCADRDANCEDILLKMPRVCTEQPQFASQMCPFSCGLCGAGDTSPCTILAVNDATVVSPQGQPSVTRGSVVQYACRDKFVLTQGQLSLACGKDGQFIGTLPVCTDEELTIQDSNNVDLIKRSSTISSRYAYTGVGSNLAITRNGVIKQWKFYSLQKGFVIFQVWRPDPAGGDFSFSLVGQSQVESKGQQAETYNLDEADWIPVQPGDSIGVFEETYTARAKVPYQTCDGQTTPADFGVVRSNGKVPYSEFSPTRSHLFASNLMCQTFSFKAVIHPVTSQRAYPDLATSNLARVSRPNIGSYGKLYIGNSTNFYIPADGYVKEWQFFAKYPGSGDFQVWRRREQLGDRKFELIGQNAVTITSSEARPYTLVVEEAERIPVQKGDIIGFRFSSSGRLGLPYSFCSLDTYPDSANILWLKLADDASSTGNVHTFSRSTGTYQCRVFSLRAIVEQVPNVA